MIIVEEPERKNLNPNGQKNKWNRTTRIFILSHFFGY